VPQARDLLASSVREMRVEDALKLLHGGDTVVTEFFARKTRAPLTERFLAHCEALDRETCAGEPVRTARRPGSPAGLAWSRRRKRTSSAM
jgi:hypothetical protein